LTGPAERQARLYVTTLRGRRGLRWKVFTTSSAAHVLIVCAQNTDIAVPVPIASLPGLRRALARQKEKKR
jgi:hypothetical protein